MSKYTYLVKTDYLDIDTIRKVFDERGNWSEYDGQGELTFFYRDGKFVYDPKLYGIRSKLSNIKNNSGRGIANKMYLYDAFYAYDKDLCRKFMAEQHPINKSTYAKFDLKNKIWILKPVKGYSGAGISIITNKSDLESAMKQTSYNDYVIAEYINNPLLILNRKFHIRTYLLIHQNKFYIDRNCELLTAKLPYYRGDYANKDIHDTHAKSSIANLYFNDTSKEYYPLRMTNYVVDQMVELFYHINRINTYKCYPESSDCFEVYGADILVTDDYRVKLLEINDKIGLLEINDKTDLWIKDNHRNKNYLSGMMETVVDQLYPPKFPVEKSGFYMDPNDFVPPKKTPYRTYMITNNAFDSEVVRDLFKDNQWGVWTIGEELGLLISDDLKTEAKYARSILINVGITNKFHLLSMFNFYDKQFSEKYLLKYHYVNTETYSTISLQNHWSIQNLDGFVIRERVDNIGYVDFWSNITNFKEFLIVEEIELESTLEVIFLINDDQYYKSKISDQKINKQVNELLKLIMLFYSDKKYMLTLFNINTADFDCLATKHFGLFVANIIITTDQQIKLVNISNDLPKMNPNDTKLFLNDIVNILFNEKMIKEKIGTFLY